MCPREIPCEVWPKLTRKTILKIFQVIQVYFNSHDQFNLYTLFSVFQ